MTRALSVAQVIAGEAVSGTPEQRIADMRAIASVIANRANLLGVTQDSIIAAPTLNGYEFNAYNTRLPPGVDDDIVAMAQEAIDYVAENGPVNNATFYATPAAVDGLPDALSFETSTDGHQFFSDPLGRAIGTAEGYKTPNAFAYAANPANVPAPGLQPSAVNQWAEMAAAPPVEAMQPSPGWGLNKDVAPALMAPTETWSEMAAAQPVQTPVDNTPSKGLFAGTPVSGFTDMAAAGPMGGQFTAPADRFAAPGVDPSQPFDRYVQTSSIPTEVDPNSYQPGTAPMVNTSAVPANRVQSVAMSPQPGVPAGLQTDGFSQMASAGPFGGDYAAPADRFGAPVEAAPQISQADIQRGLFNATGANEFDPGFVENLMGPQTAAVPTAVETVSITPSTEQSVDIASSRFSTPAKTSRIGQEQAFDTARMPGLIDPATSTASLVDQPADIGGFLAAAEAQRGPPTGIFSAEAMAQQGKVYDASLKAEAERQAAIAANAASPSLSVPSAAVNTGIPGLATSLAPAPDKGLFAAAPNFTQAMNPSVPSLASTQVDPTPGQAQEIAQASQIPGVIAAGQTPSAVTAYADETAPAPAVTAIEQQTVADPASGLFAAATPEQQLAGYQQFASAAPQITNLSGTTGIWDDGTAYSNLPATAAQVPDLQQAQEQAVDLDAVEAVDQPAISADIPGPLSKTPTVDQEEQTTQITAPAAKTTPQSTTSKPGFWDSLISPQTAIGATVGGLAAGPIGGFLGAIAGQQVAANPGMFSNEPMSINNIGSGTEAVYSIWGGGQPVGTQATASDGQVVTSMPGGSVALTNESGVTTIFDSTGKASSYFGNDLNRPQDAQDTTETSGGFFSGLFG